MQLLPNDHHTGNGNLEVVKLLLANGTNVNQQNNDGCTPLMYAEDLEIAELLLSNGANVNQKTNDGLTPLICAATNGCLEVAKLLLLNAHFPQHLSMV